MPNRNRWDDKQEQIVKQLTEALKFYKLLHYRSESYFRYWKNVFSISVIIIGFFTGILSFLSTTIRKENVVTYFQIIVGSLNVFIGSLATLSHVLKLHESAEYHRISGKHFGRLLLKVNATLETERKHRKISGQKYVNYLVEELDSLLETSPHIPKAILQHFSKAFDPSDDYRNIRISISDTIFKPMEFRQQSSTDPSEQRNTDDNIIYRRNIQDMRNRYLEMADQRGRSIDDVYPRQNIGVELSDTGKNKSVGNDIPRKRITPGINNGDLVVDIGSSALFK